MNSNIKRNLSKISCLLFSFVVAYSVLFTINYAIDIDGNFFCKKNKPNTELISDYEHSIESNFVDISDIQLLELRIALLMVYVSDPFFTLSQFAFKSSFLEEFVCRNIDPPII